MNEPSRAPGPLLALGLALAAVDILVVLAIVASFAAASLGSDLGESGEATSGSLAVAAALLTLVVAALWMGLRWLLRGRWLRALLLLAAPAIIAGAIGLFSFLTLSSISACLSSPNGGPEQCSPQAPRPPGG